MVGDDFIVCSGGTTTAFGISIDSKSPATSGTHSYDPCFLSSIVTWRQIVHSMNLFCVTVEQTNVTVRGGIEMTVMSFLFFIVGLTMRKELYGQAKIKYHNLFYDLSPIYNKRT